MRTRTKLTLLCLCLFFAGAGIFTVAVYCGGTGAALLCVAAASVRLAPLPAAATVSANYAWSIPIAVGIVVAGGIITLAVLFFTGKKRRETLEQEKERNSRFEEQLRIVSEQSGRVVFKYDIAQQKTVAGSARLEGNIARESINDYRDFFLRIDAGESPIVADFLVKKNTGENRWYRFSSTTMFSDNWEPLTAIISFYDYTDQRDREIAYKKWQQEIENIKYDNSALYEWNLTKDVCDAERGTLVVDYENLVVDSFDARTRYFADTKVFADDRAQYYALMNRERLIGMYFDKKYRDAVDYRFISDDGELRWRQISVQLVPYPNSTDIKAYVTNRDIDEIKCQELALKEMSERDARTGLFNREAFVKRFEELIKNAPGETHAILMLDIDDFKKVNDKLGHDTGDKVIVEFTERIRTTLRTDDLVGRVGGDEIMVALPNIEFDSAVEARAEQLCAALRQRIYNRISISTSIGIAVYPRDGKDFAELYKKADAALYYTKNHGKNGYYFYEDGMTRVDNGEQSEILSFRGQTWAHTVVVISESEQKTSEMAAKIEGKYRVLQINKMSDFMEQQANGSGSWLAVVLDYDSVIGSKAMGIIGNLISELNLAVIAISDQKNEDMQVRLLESGVSLLLDRTVTREHFIQCLDVIVNNRNVEQIKLQRAYRRIQSMEERRYHEVLSSTGTTVFVYDIETKSYQADLLDHQFTKGNFDGRDLSRVVLEDGIGSEDTANLINKVLERVASKEVEKATEKIQLKTRDGNQRWFSVQASLLTDTTELSPKILITVNDIDEQIKTEDELRFSAEHDALTGSYNRLAFLRQADRMIAQREAGYYVLSCIDVDNFKVINDRYGTAVGDKLLCHIVNCFEKRCGAYGGIIGRASADNFVVLYPKSLLAEDVIENLTLEASRLDEPSIKATISVGRYIVEDITLSASSMQDRALIAKESIKGRYDQHFAVYSDDMLDHLLEEQEIVNETEAALAHKQFEVWLQPQYNHSTGAIIGAEALVRWRHPEKGLIPPFKFISVFERTGFIYELDKFVWNEVCGTLRRWLDRKADVVPISVNVSRYDIMRSDFYDTITGIVEQHGIPKSLIRLELTETAFAQSPEKIIGIIDRLREYGFLIEIDDFGSGYSSLNTLKDVQADILKLDMKFLDTGKDTLRGGNIVESIIRMAKWLGMPVIAEGVETKEQADFLKTIGCPYIQGYFYAKPMPVSEYEALSVNAKKEHKTAGLETVENLDANMFWDPSSMQTLIFNSYVGGACIFEFSDDRSEGLRANEKYAQELGGGKMTIEEALKIDIYVYLDDEDRKTMRDTIQAAAESNTEAVCEVCARGLPYSKGDVYLRYAMRVIARAENRKLYYCSVNNVTDRWDAEKKVAEFAGRMQTILDNINGGVAAIQLKEDGTTNLIFANERYYGQVGYTQRQFETEVGDIFELICEEDRDEIREQSRRALRDGEPITCVYRVMRRDGEIAWIENNVTVTSFEGIEGPVQLTVANDITDQMMSEQKFIETSAQLKAIVSNMAGGLSVAKLINGEVEYIFVNDQYYKLFGYTREEFAKEVPRGIVDLVAKEDLERVIDAANEAAKDGSSYVLEFRVTKRDGSLAWIRSQGSVAYFMGGEQPIQIAMSYDITSEKQQSKFSEDFLDNLPRGAGIYESDGKQIWTRYVNKAYLDMAGIDKPRDMDNGVIQVIHPDDRQPALAAMKNSAKGKPMSINIRILHKNGNYIPVNLSGRAVINPDGKMTAYAIYTPIAAEKQNLEKLLPVMLEAMMATSKNLSFVKNKNLEYLCSTKEFALMVGLTDEKQVAGKTDFDLFDAALAKKYRRDDQNLIKGGKSLVDYIEPLPAEDGTVRYSQTSKYLLYDEVGEVIGIYGIGRDITSEIENARLQKILEIAVSTGYERLCIVHTDTGECETVGARDGAAKKESYADIIKDRAENHIAFVGRIGYYRKMALETVARNLKTGNGEYSVVYERDDGKIEIKFYDLDKDKNEILLTVRKLEKTAE